MSAVFAAMMVLPAAAATWYGPGSYEPDTLYDATQGWMHLNPDVDPNPTVRKVYFNVFTTAYAVTLPYNSGTMGSRVREFPLLYYEALLGVWKDCNKDGYIGNVESALIVYPAAMADTNVCPARPGSTTDHNDGEWVYEFLHLGPTWGSSDAGTAPGILNTSWGDGSDGKSDGAYVWGDPGLPGGEPGQSCPLAPLPHGTSAGTGAFIRWADCLQGQRITDTVNAIDADGTMGLRFDGCPGMDDEECQKNPQKSDSLLNQELPESLFGNPRTRETGTLQKDPENDGEYAFTTWDCDAKKGGADVHDDLADGSDGQREAPLVAQGDHEVGVSRVQLADPRGGTISQNLTDEEGSYAYVAKPAPAPGDPRWSVAGGVNDTANGVAVAVAEDNCNGGNPYNSAHNLGFFYADGDFEGTAQAPGKNKAQYDFTFADGAKANRDARRGACGPADTPAEDACTPGLGERVPRYGGVTRGSWLLREGWSSGIITATAIPQSVDDETGEPIPRLYYTYHAYVDPAAIAAYGLRMPAGATMGVYGSENCETIGAGAVIQKGWVCDPSLWNLDPQGEYIGEEHFRVVGDPFNLRDIDCYDGTLARGLPVRASLVDITDEGACLDAPTS